MPDGSSPVDEMSTPPAGGPSNRLSALPRHLKKPPTNSAPAARTGLPFTTIPKLIHRASIQGGGNIQSPINLGGVYVPLPIMSASFNSPIASAVRAIRISSFGRPDKIDHRRGESLTRKRLAGRLRSLIRVVSLPSHWL